MDPFDSDYNDSDINDNSLYYEDIEIFSEIEPDIISAVCFILIFCISIFGNSFFLWALLRERAWKTVSDILLLQLTISDLCFTATLPFMACNLLHRWIFGGWVCRVLHGATFLGLNSYVLILTAMTLYQYVAVVHVSCLSTPATKTLFDIIASIVIWLACVAVGIKALVNSEVRDLQGLGEKICVHFSQSMSMYLLDIYLQIGLFFLIPFIIMTFCCVHTWLTIKQNRMNRNRQGSRLNLGLVIVFFLGLSPYNIIEFIISLIVFGVPEIPVAWLDHLHHVEFILNTLLSLHCCLNPLIHIFGAQRFRKHLPMPFATLPQRREDSERHSSMEVIPPHDHTPLCDHPPNICLDTL